MAQQGGYGGSLVLPTTAGAEQGEGGIVVVTCPLGASVEACPGGPLSGRGRGWDQGWDRGESPAPPELFPSGPQSTLHLPFAVLLLEIVEKSSLKPQGIAQGPCDGGRVLPPSRLAG